VTAGKHFDEVAVAVHAESVVIESRIAELAAENQALRRKTSAARGQLTRAMRDGDAARIAEAHARLRDREAQEAATLDANIEEMQGLLQRGLSNLAELFGAWDEIEAGG
jgi:ribosomal 50S subunit-associated protein YjgA (DUF615 family)